MYIFTYSPKCHQQVPTSEWFINRNYSPSTQQHQAHSSHHVHKQLWLISTSCNAPRHDTYMHVVSNHLRGRHPMMQQTHHNHPELSPWIIEYNVFYNNMLWCMNIWLNRQQCICSHNFNNRHQHFHNMLTPPIQHHCIYENPPTIYMHVYIYNHQQHYHNNSTTSEKFSQFK